MVHQWICVLFCIIHKAIDNGKAFCVQDFSQMDRCCKNRIRNLIKWPSNSPCSLWYIIGLLWSLLYAVHALGKEMTIPRDREMGRLVLKFYKLSKFRINTGVLWTQVTHTSWGAYVIHVHVVLTLASNEKANLVWLWYFGSWRYLSSRVWFCLDI